MQVAVQTDDWSREREREEERWQKKKKVAGEDYKFIIVIIFMEWAYLLTYYYSYLVSPFFLLVSRFSNQQQQ